MFDPFLYPGRIKRWTEQCFQIRKVIIIKQKITEYNQLDNWTKNSMHPKNHRYKKHYQTKVTEHLKFKNIVA